MTLASLGVVIDPTEAKSGAAEVKKELASVAAGAEQAVQKVEAAAEAAADAIKEAGDAAVQAQQQAGAAVQSETSRASRAAQNAGAELIRANDSVVASARRVAASVKESNTTAVASNQTVAASVKAAFGDTDTTVARTLRDARGRFISSSAESAQAATSAGEAIRRSNQQSSNSTRQLSEDMEAAAKRGKVSLDDLKEAAAELAASLGAGLYIREGLQFNAMLEDATLGIAAIQRQFNPDKYQDFAAAMKVSAEAVDQLKIKAAESPATFEALVGAFQATAGAAAQSSMSLRQHIDLIVVMSQALKGLGIRDDQIVQESRALMTGNITEDAAAARILGITKADIDQAREAGELFEFLSGKMAAFGEAGKAAAGSLSVQFSNLKDTIQQLAGKATLDLFQQIRGRIGEITTALNQPKGQDAIRDLVNVLTAMGEVLFTITRLAIEHSSTLATVARGYLALVAAQKLLQFTAWISGLTATTAAMFANTTATAANTAAVNANGLARARMGRLGGSLALTAGIIGVTAVAQKNSEADDRWREIDEATKALARQVGQAETVNARMEAQAAILRQISALQSDLAQTKQSGEWFSGREISTMEKGLQYLQRLNVEFDQRAGKMAQQERTLAATTARQAEVVAWYRKEIDAATELEQQQQLLKQLQAEVVNIPAQYLHAKAVDATSAAWKAYNAELMRIVATFDQLAGKQAEATAAEKQYAQDTAAINAVLGDQLKLAEAKANGDLKTVQAMEDQKRISELLKADGLQAINDKDRLLAVVQQILAAENAVADAVHRQSIADKSRAYRLTGLEGGARTSELRRQLQEVQKEQAAGLRQAGLLTIPDQPTSRDLQALVEAGTAGLDTMELTGGPNAKTIDLQLSESRDKIRALEMGIADAEKSLQRTSTKGVHVAGSAVKLQVQSDTATLAELVKQLRALQDQAGNMTAAELTRRTATLKTNATGSLVDPMGAAAKYPELIDRFRAFKLEQERIESETNARIQANQAGMFESFMHGAQRASEQFGGLSQQVDKLGNGIAGSLANNMTAAFVAMADGSKSAGEAFRDMAVGILNDIAKMIIQLLVELAVRQAIKSLSGFAGGGSVGTSSAGSAAAAGGVNGYAVGGPVWGGKGGIDDIPALLTRGEYVIPKDAAEYYGVGWLDAVRRKQVTKYATGGPVATPVRPQAPAANGSDVYSFDIHVDARGGEDGMDGGDRKSREQRGRMMAEQMRVIAQQVLNENLRNGGALAKGGRR